MDVKEGAGTAVQDSIVNAACKYPRRASRTIDARHVVGRRHKPLHEDLALTPEQLQDFFAAAARAGRNDTTGKESCRYALVVEAFPRIERPLVVDEYLSNLKSMRYQRTTSRHRRAPIAGSSSRPWTRYRGEL